jgi:hypothetical protein
MNDEQLFASIAQQLEPAVNAFGGKFSVAQDPFQVMELLGQGPNTFRVILHDDGEDRAGDSTFPAATLHRYKVTVSTNRGLPLMAGKPVVEPDATNASLLARTNAVRDAMRAFTFPACTWGRLSYQGRNTVVYDGARLDAYELTFTLLAALPFPATA